MTTTVIYFFYSLPRQIQAMDVLAKYSLAPMARGNGGIGYLKVRAKTKDVYGMERAIGRIV